MKAVVAVRARRGRTALGKETRAAVAELRCSAPATSLEGNGWGEKVRVVAAELERAVSSGGVARRWGFHGGAWWVAMAWGGEVSGGVEGLSSRRGKRGESKRRSGAGGWGRIGSGGGK